jgi:hypothetical protein
VEENEGEEEGDGRQRKEEQPTPSLVGDLAPHGPPFPCAGPFAEQRKLIHLCVASSPEYQNGCWFGSPVESIILTFYT